MTAIDYAIEGSQVPLGRFAPVSRCEFSDVDFGSGRITGYASPLQGVAPCLLALMSGKTVVALARATRFSQAACDISLRRGWCGFVIGGLQQALALGHEVDLRCVLSGRLLRHWDTEELVNSAATRPRKPMGIAQLREYLCADGGCLDLRQVVSFAVDLSAKHGRHATLDASYRYLLLRSVDPAASANFSGDLLTAEDISTLWKSITISDEFQRTRSTMFPGPFDGGFEFPIDGLDVGQA